MSEFEEYGPFLAKLLDRTKSQKIHWNVEAPSKFGVPIHGNPGFEATLPDSATSSYHFKLSTSGTSDDRVIFLRMYDSQNQEIFHLQSYSFPTDQAQEKLSDSLEELYEAVRRQVLKVPEKIKIVSDLLDRA